MGKEQKNKKLTKKKPAKTMKEKKQAKREKKNEKKNQGILKIPTSGWKIIKCELVWSPQFPERVPPRRYGPWERVVSLLTEGL